MSELKFKVIADYPENVRKVGDIISDENGDIISQYTIAFYRKYRHLFKELTEEEYNEYTKPKA